MEKTIKIRTPVGTATLDEKINRWEIRATPEAIIMIKRILTQCNDVMPGKIYVQDNPKTARDLHWISMRYPLTFNCPTPIEERATEFEDHLQKLQTILLHGATQDYQLELPPRNYQKIAAELLIFNKSLLLADEVGLGKTVSSLCAISQAELRPAVVVCPAHLAIQWSNFIKKFLPTCKAEIAKTGRPHALKKGTEILIISYAKLKGWIHHLGLPQNLPKTLIFDEIQELRRPESQKYQAAKNLAELIEYKLGASASPITNYGGEIFHILQILAPNRLGNEQEFKREWCSHSFSKNKWIINDPDALGSHLRNEFLMLRRTRKDVRRELPALTTTIHTVPYDTTILRNAEAASLQLAKILLEGEFTAQGQAARELDLKLRQATGLAKSNFVAEFARMYLQEKTPLILCGWHHACFRKGTKIIMFDGTLKKVEDVKVGDILLGPDSKPRKVKNLTQGHGDMIKITPTKGNPWVCSENHILVLKKERGKSLTKIRAGEFHKYSDRKKRAHVLFRTTQIKFSKSKPPHPWFVGYWLGNGTANLRQTEISTAEPEVEQYLNELAERYNLKVSDYELYVNDKKNKCKLFRLVNKHPGPKGNPLTLFLRSLNLTNNKHIPSCYKTASIKTRRTLLAGIIDSDGHIHRGKNSAGSACITFTNKQLAEDTAFVCRSLGLAAYITPKYRKTEKSKNPNWHYIINISGNLKDIITKVPRKRGHKRTNRKNVLHTGLKTEKLEEEDFYGFEVDHDNLILLEDFTVAHNCYEVWKHTLEEFNPVFYTGAQNPREKEESLQKFLSGETNLFVLSLRSGLGIDGLQYRCSTILHGELDWSSSFHHQCTGRIHRDGQPDPVSSVYLLADGGSDPIVSQILGIKKEQARGITDPRMLLDPKDENDPDKKSPEERQKEEIHRIKILASHLLKKHGIKHAVPEYAKATKG